MKLLPNPFRAAAAFCPFLFSLAGVSYGQTPLPRVPFSGVYGGTAGAGSIPGWDRTGGGENPAVLGAPGWTLSGAGYAPFGLDGLRVTEAVTAWDRPRWGISGSYQGIFADGAEVTSAASRVGVQSAFRVGGPRSGWTTGVSGAFGTKGIPLETGVGMLWRPRSWGSFGAFWQREGNRERMGLGADAGTPLFASGFAWRVCAESIYARGFENRFAAALQLHALLSVYTGWDPARETVGFGMRFGMGAWEGFSSMRRHAALGGVSVQGLRWHP
jgi:hypothetical protein